jgi:competence protein ComEC
MAAVALAGVLANRPAVTLRALAAAAFAVLVVAPESLLSVGFQMSFAATLALVAAYEWARAAGWLGPQAAPGRRLMRYAAGVFLTSLIAGAATAPFAATHFNRLTTYGLAANLLAAPVLGLWAAPALIAAAAAAPFGAEGPILWVAGAGIDWILAVARFFAGLEGAVRPVEVAPLGAFAAIVIGGLWLCLWRSGLRWFGAAAVGLGLALWTAAPPRPAALVAPGGALIGVMTPLGRSVDHPRASGFAAESWLRRDGDPATQAEAADRPVWRRGDGVSEASLPRGWRLVRVGDRTSRAKALAQCRPATVVVAPALDIGSEAETGANAGMNTDAEAGAEIGANAGAEIGVHPAGCLLFDRGRLARTGALALAPAEGGLRVRTAQEAAGARLWTGAAAP